MKEVGQITCKVKPDFSGWVNIGYTTLENVVVKPDWMDDRDVPAFSLRSFSGTISFKPTYVNIPLLMGWDARTRERTRKRLSRMHSMYHRRRK